MKKYLMTGIAALALCVGFTSCSHDLESLSQEEIEKLEAQKIVDKYNKAFKAYIGGEVAANQNWGFGTPAAGSRTRTENANANEWADPTKAYGGLKVPPPLTDAQIAVVKKYFQTHKDLGYEDPKWKNYFVQQVYKGNPQTAGQLSPEKYLSAAGGENYILASDHMDHLIAIDTEKGIVDHINNFNHGDCSPNGDVLNNGEHVGGAHHTDKIMLMQNSTTKSFAYHNSDGSLYHTEYTGLVSYKTIMEAMGAEANCLDDGWNRSFMGFDFEQIVGDDVYSKTIETEGGWTSPENYEEGAEYINGFKVKSITYHTFEFEGETYNFLKNETNQFCADRTETSYVQKNGSTSNDGGKANFNDRPSDEIIRDLLSKGYLPYTTELKDWVKIGGCADGVYSDWIVTLTKATRQNEPDPETYSIRVMAEDLSATEASDFDFNDVVIDVYFTTDEDEATIILQAAGGTLPLRINEDNTKEVHDLFGVGRNVMVNTRWSGSNGASKKPVSFTIPFELSDLNNDGDIDVDDFLLKVKTIKLEVYKTYSTGNPDWFEMTADEGAPAAKFAVPIYDDEENEVEWARERQSLKDLYGKFSDWATNAPWIKWWNRDKALAEEAKENQQNQGN